MGFRPRRCRGRRSRSFHPFLAVPAAGHGSGRVPLRLRETLRPGLAARAEAAGQEEAAARPEADLLFAGSLEQDERRAAIDAALHKLPENQREVLVMKIWGGLSFPQIAEVLRISANTAASRYRYALAKLREQLAEETIP
jgi:RNA polymerase sigma factor (sigma-70 family)